MYKHRATSSTSLPPILEDATQFPPPPLPPRASYRPLQTHFGFGNPPILRYSPPPPAYSARIRNLPYLGGDNEGPFDEKLEALRNNRQIAKRGGWRRLCVIAFIVLKIVVGLGIGLGVGLTRKKNGNNNKSGSNGSDSSDQIPETGQTNPVFPAGSYSIPTYLSTVTTNCTSNPATWLCYPYTIYAQSPSSSSEATFTWIITPNSSTSTNTPINYTISSTPNPFSTHFTNTSLTLLDPGLNTERYTFEVDIRKPVIPSVALTQENEAATCWFNGTVLRASLYTKMPKSYDGVGGENSTDSGSGSGSGSGDVYHPWPYAVQIEESSTSGTGTPTCVDSEGKILGDFSVGGNGSDGGEVCDCLYLNTGT